MIAYDNGEIICICDNCTSEIFGECQSFGGKHYCQDCLTMFSYYNEDSEQAPFAGENMYMDWEPIDENGIGY